MMYIKIFGIERSGTNFIEQLIKQNTNATKVFSNCYAWKHGVIEKNMKDCDKDYNVKKMNAIVISKNPYLWFNSIKRYSKEFERASFEFWFKKYNKLYKHYIDFKPQGFWCKKYIVRYEDLLLDPKDSLEKICDHFGIELNNKLNVPTKVFMSGEFTEERKDYYLSTPKMKPYLINKINQHIEKRIFNELNYERL